MTTCLETVRAGVYARISSDRDGEALGVERQLTDCRKLCSERGWTIVAEYVDNNLSASAEGVTRPEYERLLEDIANRELDSVAVWDLDRLTRQPLQLEQFVRTCEQAGMTRLALIGGNVDIGTGDGLLVARIKGAVAAEESRKTGQRIRRKHQELAEKGLYHGGGARPFGFEPDGITVREDEAALIREAAGRILKVARSMASARIGPSAVSRPSAVSHGQSSRSEGPSFGHGSPGCASTRARFWGRPSGQPSSTRRRGMRCASC